MPLYRYTAKNLSSEKMRGQLEAADSIQLASRLREQNQYLISCTELGESAVRGYKLKALELSSFARELGTMLSSGITLIRAMSILLQQDTKPKIKKHYQSVYEGLTHGLSFSEALESQNGAFPRLMVSMIRAGEASGSMDQTAKKIAQHYEKEHKLQTKIKSAMTYPIILLVVAFVAVIGIFTLILPNFFDILKDTELPPITQVIINISNTLTQHWLICLVAAMAVVLLSVSIFHLPRVQLAWAKAKLRLPKVGPLMQVIYTARFARTLSTLYSCGLSMIQALEVAAETIGNQYIANQFSDVVIKVRGGTALSQAIREVDGFMPKLSAVTYIGEESGRLDEMLDSMADSFDYESERAMDKLVSLLEPALIVVLAVIIGTIMLAVMLPLYSLYQSIG